MAWISADIYSTVSIYNYDLYDSAWSFSVGPRRRSCAEQTRVSGPEIACWVELASAAKLLINNVSMLQSVLRVLNKKLLKMDQYSKVFFAGLWIRIRIGSGFCDFVDPNSMTLWIRIRIGNPDPGSGSRGKKIKWKMYFLVLFRIRNWIQIRIELKCWIRIRIWIESIQIHNPGFLCMLQI
jgi:hypothetical protein